MNRARINYAVVRHLILKDWYLNRWVILGSLPVGLGALALVLTGKQVAFMVCIILLSMVIVGVGAQLAMVTTINERKEQTLAFVMSLPVSFREYTAAKILGNLIIFLIPWLPLTAGALVVLLLPGATHGLVPYTAIMSLEMLITTSLIVAAGIITESQAWTTPAFSARVSASTSWGTSLPICAASRGTCGAHACTGAQRPGSS